MVFCFSCRCEHKQPPQKSKESNVMEGHPVDKVDYSKRKSYPWDFPVNNDSFYNKINQGIWLTRAKKFKAVMHSFETFVPSVKQAMIDSMGLDYESNDPVKKIFVDLHKSDTLEKLIINYNKFLKANFTRDEFSLLLLDTISHIDMRNASVNGALAQLQTYYLFNLKVYESRILPYWISKQNNTVYVSKTY